MNILIYAFGLSALLIVLGFVALLKQKTYLDVNTQQPVQVDIPVLGKVKTNYPALIFVLLGFALAWMAFEKSFPPRQETWKLTGVLKSPPGHTNRIEWEDGTLTLTPSALEPTIYDSGAFQMNALVEEGKSIDDAYETLDFSLPSGSVQINLKKQLTAYKAGQSNLVENLTAHTVNFKPLELQLYSQ